MPGLQGPKALLATSVWWPASARLASRLIHYGCRLSALCPRGHVLFKVRGMERVYPYRGLDSLKSLEMAIQDVRPDIVIPGDDRVVWQMHELYKSRSDLRALIDASLGPAAHHHVVMSRAQLLEVACDLEIRVPETHHIRSVSDIHEWFARTAPSAILKGDGTCGGAGVYIAHSENEAIAAFHKLNRRVGMVAAWKHFLVNRDPVALWEWRKQTSRSMAIQRLIVGRPANAMLATWRGELLGLVMVEVLSAQGPTGAALIVREIDNPEMASAAERLTKRLELSGFCGLDFVLADETGLPHLIEMNPRFTQLGHLALRKPTDLAGLLYAKLAGRTDPPLGVPIDNSVVAFFPQASVWNPDNPHMRTAHLDVPLEDPGLAREISKELWPDRQLRARVYHFFFPPEKIAAVDFERARV